MNLETNILILLGSRQVIMAMRLIPILMIGSIVKIQSIGPNMTDVDESYIGKKLSEVVDLLMNNYNYLQTHIKEIDNYTQCGYNDACDGNTDINPMDLRLIEYGNQSVQFNETTIKFLHGTNKTEIMNEVCYVLLSQESIWESNIYQRINQDNTNRTGGVVWQYYGSDSGTTIFYPRFEWTKPCANSALTDYDPRNRPWYVSAISAQKNVILLIDLSDVLPDPANKRLNRMKQSANLLLSSLSYRDFVGIITYTDYSKQYMPLMMRCTLSEIDRHIKYIESLAIINNSKANIGSGLMSAYTLLTNSIKNDITSKCTNVFIVLSSGANNVNAERSVNIIKKYPDPVVTIFSNIYRLNPEQGGMLDLAEASCHTNGNLLIIDTDQDASYTILKFNQYMATATYNTFIRWSEPYDDAITGIRTVTGSLPIYVNKQDKPIGVVAIDITLDLLRGILASVDSASVDTDLTEQNILNYLIKEQSCPSLQITPSFLKQIQSPDTCKHLDQGTKQQTGYVKNKDWMIAGSIIIALFAIAFPCLLVFPCNNTRNEPGKNDDKCCCGVWLSLTMFILALWALCVLWIHLFPQIIKYENWIKTKCTVERIDQNPSRCCEIKNCADCQEFSGPSCGSLVSSQIEGACGIGYHCCYEYCQTCNCYTTCSSTKDSTSCSTNCMTCCYCGASVSNNKCNVVCGTCWDPVVTSRFKDQNNETMYGYTNIHCGLNDIGCLNRFVDSNSPIGKSESCYFNPENKNEIVMSIAYSPGDLAAFLIPSIAMGVIFIGVLIGICSDDC